MTKIIDVFNVIYNDCEREIFLSKARNNGVGSRIFSVVKQEL